MVRGATAGLIAFDVPLDGAALLRERSAMPSFSAFEAAAPQLAAAVRARLAAHVHLTLATLRRDGSPRISGTEIRFADGEMFIGSMPQARKALDLLRDPRFALHSGSEDPPAWSGDAKVAGVAEEVTDAALVRAVAGDAGEAHVFRLDVHEASTVTVDEAAKLLIIDVWTPDRGVRRIERT